MPLDISQVKFPDQMNIREAALYLGVGEQRVRALNRGGELKGDNTSGRLLFKKSDLDAFKTTPKTRAIGERADGKAWVIRVKGTDLAEVKAFLEKKGIKLEQRYNLEKMKSYQAKRKAELKAQKEAAAATPATPVKK